MLIRKTLARLKNRPKGSRLRPLAAIGAGSLALGGVLFVVASSLPLALAALAAGVLGFLGAYMAQRATSTTSLIYDDLDGDVALRFAVVGEACKDLSSSERIWRLSDSPEQRTLKAGDTYFPSEREFAQVGLLEIPGIRANIPIWGIDAGDGKIFFFPEGVLTYRNERYEGISNKLFKVGFSPARYFEEEAIPEDAEVVISCTWRYTRKDGSLDRRYTPNPQIPVILYGVLHITGPSGLDVCLQVSNRVAAARFARAFGARTREENPHREAAGSNGQESESRSADEEKAESLARVVLGVTEGVSMAEITTAYRKLAQTYHLDRVAHLALEARESADHKMREINAAYAQMKRQRATYAGRSRAERQRTARRGKMRHPAHLQTPHDSGIL
jgi:hypothetical protein